MAGSFWEYYAALVAFIGAIAAMFEYMEKAASSTAKDSIRTWLKDVDPATWLRQLSETFAKAFDSVFGDRLFSLRCLGITTALSVFWVLVLTAIWAFLRPSEFNQWGAGGWLTRIGLGAWLQGMVANVLPDYLSLAETRYVIERTKRAKRARSLLLWLLADLLVTGIIFFTGYVIWVSFDGFYFWFVYSLPLHQFWAMQVVPEILHVPQLLVDVILPLHVHPEPDRVFGLGAAPGIFFYSTFLTSLWFWLYAISAIAARAARLTERTFPKVVSWVDLDNAPVRGLGAISILLIFIAANLFIPLALFAL